MKRLDNVPLSSNKLELPLKYLVVVMASMMVIPMSQADVAGKKIGDLEFLYFNGALFNNNHQYVMNQVMYSTMYKGYDLSFNISYKGEENHKFLLELLSKSKFD